MGSSNLPRSRIDLSGDSDSATSDTILPVLFQGSLDGANQGSASEDLGSPILAARSRRANQVRAERLQQAECEARRRPQR